MDRREFLKMSAATCVSGAFVSCVRESNQGIIGMALVGCGRQGRSLMTNFLGVGEAHQARFFAVCDVDIDRAKKARESILSHYESIGVNQEVKVYQYPEQLLKNRKIDACVIAVTDRSHASVTLQALNAGCDVYLEKPIAFSIEEGQALVQAVRRRRAVFQAGTQQRSSIYFRRVCELVRQGKIGALKHVEVRLPRDEGVVDFEEMGVPKSLDYMRWLGEMAFVPYTEKRVHPRANFGRPGWMQVEDYCYGMITNWGSHMFDIAQWGSGNELSGPVRIHATSTYEDRGIWTVHTKIEGELEYANGLKVDLVSIDQRQGASPGVRFTGEAGWLDVTRGGFKAHDRNCLRWVPKPGEEVLQVSRNHYADFLESIVSRKDPVAPIEQAHRTNTVCLLLAQSGKTGREIRWNPCAEQYV